MQTSSSAKEVARDDRRSQNLLCRCPLGLVALLVVTVMGLAIGTWADDPGGLATNDFGNNGEDAVPPSAYLIGKMQRENKEYQKENPDVAKRSYYEKGGASSNDDSKCRARVAYKAARYQGPKNGYKADRTDDGTGHKDGPRPEPGGGNYAADMPDKAHDIINNIYKFVEDVVYPKKASNPNDPYISDKDFCDKIESGLLDIGKAEDGHPFVCKETVHFFTSLCRELGFPTREKNVLPSLKDNTYDIQTAAANIWYDGEWHFFDPWESFTASTGYLERTGHGGYGPYHDADVYVRESPPSWKGKSDYRATKDGTLGDPSGWKKHKTHKRNGASIDTNTFTLRLEVQDGLGSRTGAVTGLPEQGIPDSIYFPFDTPFNTEMTKGSDPLPQLYGTELVTLLYSDREPPGVRSYDLLIKNLDLLNTFFTVNLSGHAETVNLQVSPGEIHGVLAPLEIQVFPFTVSIGEPLVLPPVPVQGAHVSGRQDPVYKITWPPIEGASEYRVYSSPQAFESPTDPGVEFLGVTLVNSITVELPADTLVGVEAVGPTGLRSGLDPDGGSTTLALGSFVTEIPALSDWGLIVLALLLLIAGTLWANFGRNTSY